MSISQIENALVETANSAHHTDNGMSSSNEERILLIANARIASLQISFIEPLKSDVEDGKVKTDYFIWKEEQDRENKQKTEEGVLRRIENFFPTLIVFCRYSGRYAQGIVEWAEKNKVPTIFHIDDDLLNVPSSVGSDTQSLHQEEKKLNTIKYLIDNCSTVFCSTKPLLKKLFGDNPPDRALAGEIYCAHNILSKPKYNSMPVIGYMGTRTHAGDLALVVPALERVLDINPNICFEIFGSIEIPEKLVRFGDRIRRIPQVSNYVDFINTLASLNWAIGICPLIRSEFNLMKADTKWVEYTASGFAVVASRNTVYDHCCADGCGLTAETDNEWFEAIRSLIENHELHKKTVELAQNRLANEYNPRKLHSQLWSVFEHAKATVASHPDFEQVDNDTSVSSNFRSHERIMFISNDMIPSLQLSFVVPLEPLVLTQKLSVAYLTEAEIFEVWGKNFRKETAKEWVFDKINSYNPTLIVFCRYSGPHAREILSLASKKQIPTVFHIDDDLLNIPIEIGEKKYRAHNAPERLETVRDLLDNTTVVYCSTRKLEHRFFGNASSPRAISGNIYCAHKVLTSPNFDSPQTIGYMGFDHAHDFKIAIPALVRLLDARPALTFEMFGSIPIPEELIRFGSRIRIIEPVRDYKAFIRKLSSLDWTIGICPLAKHSFNEVKADTKWVEYTASGFAVIASGGTVYDHCCSGGCGILAESEEEWLRAFEFLLDDKAARQKQVQQAQDKLRLSYSPNQLREQIAMVFEQAHQLNEQNYASKYKISPVHVSLEEVTGANIKGWAWETEDLSEDGSKIEIMCGNTRLGWCDRYVSRPDVDAHVNNSGRHKGFLMPIGCLSVLYQLMDMFEGLHPRIRFCDKSFSLHNPNSYLNNLAEYRTLRLVDGINSLRVADLWWGSSRLLKVRTHIIEQDAPNLKTNIIHVYQPVSDDKDGMFLKLVDEITVSNKSTIYSIGVKNPYMPILFVGRTANGEICFTDLVPFPSLLRGGLHESEVGSLSEDGNDLVDLRRLSDNYVTEFVGVDNLSLDFSIGAIKIDLTNAKGTEPIFDPVLRVWLAKMLKISIQISGVEARIVKDMNDKTFTDHAIASLANIYPTKERKEAAWLSLPAFAAPTIAALVARRASLPAELSVAPHIVTDPVAPSKRWLVTLPEGGPLMRTPSLSANACLTFPTVSHGTKKAPLDDRLLPLAIVFRDLAPQINSELIFPVPVDLPHILPNLSAESAPTISVVVMIDEGEPNLRNLIVSIANQMSASVIEVIVGLAVPEWRSSRYRHLLEELLPGRGRVVANLHGINQCSALNKAVALATGDVLIVLDTNVILHDNRTLGTLARLANVADTGTVGCMQVKAKKPGEKPIVFKSGGLFPGRLDFASTPGLGLQELICDKILTKTVYPVAANTSHCIAVSMTTWKEANGLDIHYRLRHHALIEFAMRLAEMGRSNFCTTLLSVYVDQSIPQTNVVDIYTLARIDLWRLLPAIRKSTVMRSF